RRPICQPSKPYCSANGPKSGITSEKPMRSIKTIRITIPSGDIGELLPLDASDVRGRDDSNRGGFKPRTLLARPGNPGPHFGDQPPLRDESRALHDDRDEVEAEREAGDPQPPSSPRRAQPGGRGDGRHAAEDEPG